MELILASASPRRADILRSLGFSVSIHPSDVEEAVLPGEGPEEHAVRLAREKAGSVALDLPGDWVLAGDTVVVLGGEILGKPRGPDEAIETLLRLEGKEHRVVSALALVRPAGDRPGESAPAIFSGVQDTVVRMRPFDRALAEAYVATGEPLDKAGAYGIQGMGAALVIGIEGDYSGVVGLPVPLLVRLLREAGRPYRFGTDRSTGGSLHERRSP